MIESFKLPNITPETLTGSICCDTGDTTVEYIKIV